MKTLFTKRSIFIASVAVLIAIITLISVNIFNTSGPVTGIAGTVSRPLRTLASNVARVFENIYSSYYRYDNLMADYEGSLRKLTQYERDFSEAIALRAENDRLTKLLELQKRNTGYKYEQAMVVNRSGSNWTSTFSINLGYANSDIEVGQAVITEYGILLGQVFEVDAVNSTVITILDTKFSAGTYVGISRGGATAKGDFSLMRSGLFMLDRISDDLVVLPGDSIVTSGGGVFPAGLVVGTVVDVYRHNTGIGRYATAKPMLDSNMSYVFVITDFKNARDPTEEDAITEEESPSGETATEGESSSGEATTEGDSSPEIATTEGDSSLEVAGEGGEILQNNTGEDMEIGSWDSP